ncbi:hypothetical protein IWW55_003171 [Coemansia sp. RSA 2706]|nr:hypothetical protein LPJ63_004045 [Coemansia sp. RSA 2711]KAJ2302952.1 hypothetical protein IWW55_003171 [Coemansia sp. RSA 2706]KAJ2325472.1 hypothetical protein IWW51_002771 [Coemansia sp. RSA 2702]
MASGRDTGRKERATNSCLMDIGEPSEEAHSAPPFLLSTAPQHEERKTYRIEPPSGLLSRLHAFLPQIAEANKKLEADVSEDPSQVDIENVGADESQYIEMDLGLGVFDMKPKPDQQSTDGIVIGARGNGSNDDSDDEGSDGSSSGVVINPSAISSRQKPKPHIEVLANGSSSSSDTLESSSDSGSSSGSDSDEEMSM